MDKKELITKTRQLKVLYIEDEISIRTFTAMLFKKYFKEVIEGSDGEEGLELYKKDNFDLVISDRNLPKLNGEQMIKEILEINNEQFSVLMTAENDREYEILKNNNVFFLNKPLLAEEFDEILRKVVS